MIKTYHPNEIEIWIAGVKIIPEDNAVIEYAPDNVSMKQARTRYRQTEGAHRLGFRPWARAWAKITGARCVGKLARVCK